jgi:MFS family permease
MIKILLFALVRGLSSGIYGPLWALILQAGDIGWALLGVLSSWYELTRLFTEIPTGVLSEKMGFRATFVLAGCLSLLGWVLWFVFQNLWGAFALTFLIASSEAFTSGAFEAYALKLVGEKQFSSLLLKATQYHLFSFALAGIIGCGIFEYAPSLFSYVLFSIYIARVIFYYFLVGNLHSGTDASMRNRSGRHTSPSIFAIFSQVVPQMRKNTQFLFICLFSFLAGSGFAAVEHFWQPYLIAKGINPLRLGFVSAAAALVAITSISISARGRASASHRSWVYLFWVKVMAFTLCSLLACQLSPVLFFCFLTILLALENLRMPFFQSFVSSYLTGSFKTVQFSTVSASAALGEVLSGFVLGRLAEAWGIQAVFVAAAVIFALTLLILAAMMIMRNMAPFSTPVEKA